MFHLCDSTGALSGGELDVRFLSRVYLFMAISGAAVLWPPAEVRAHSEDDLFRSESRGKEEVFAREEWEFRLPSNEVRGYSLGDFQDVKRVVLVAFPWGDCPDRQLRDWIISTNKIGGSKFRIIPIDPHADSRTENALQSYRDVVGREWRGTGVRHLFDSLQIVSTSLLFMNAGDFAVFDPRGPTLLHSGEAEELRSPTSRLFERYLQGSRALPTKMSEEKCAIRYRSYEGLSFDDGFLKPFSRACQTCHVRSEVYDMFPDLKSVVGWRAMSLRTIRLGRMPGIHDPYYRHPRERGVSTDDVRKVVHWLSHGPDHSEKMNLEFARDHAERVRLGAQETKSVATPALSLSVGEPGKPQMIPAEGKLRYFHVKLGEPLREDIILQGIQANLNLNVIHHANVMAFPPGMSPAIYGFGRPSTSLGSFEDTMRYFMGPITIEGFRGHLDKKPAKFVRMFEPMLTTFSRRAGLIEFPEDRAFTLPKGTQLGLQLHIQPSGVVEPLLAQFQFFRRESKAPYQNLKRFSIVPTKGFVLPAGKKSYLSVAEVPFSKNTRVHTLWVHTHYRGVAARIRVLRRNGNEVTVASFPFLQMKMNAVRNFTPPLQLNVGDKIVTEVEYDNSKNNLANPDPTKSVLLGGTTLEDEMHYPRFIVSEEGGE